MSMNVHPMVAWVHASKTVQTHLGHSTAAVTMVIFKVETTAMV